MAAVVGADTGLFQMNALAMLGQVQRTLGECSNPISDQRLFLVGQGDGPAAQVQGASQSLRDFKKKMAGSRS
jgi:hypothetical protein